MREDTAQTIRELALHEPQVKAAMNFYTKNGLSWTEMLERLVLMLVENKVVLNRELTRALANSTRSAVPYLDPNTIDEDGDKGFGWAQEKGKC